jgi:hypothetical protein
MLTTVARVLLSIAVASLSLWLAWNCITVGAARFIDARARVPQEAEIATVLLPSDPEGHFVYAWLLSEARDLEKSTLAYERAIRLRPRDHVLWVQLAKVRERAGDPEGALRAFTNAVRLAPHYAEPRWQLGNALLRAGQRKEAVEELRQAAETDPSLYPNFLQTLWYTSGRDASFLTREVRPSTSRQALSLASFLISVGAAQEGMRALRDAGVELSEDGRRDLVKELLSAQQFADAYDVWSRGRQEGRGSFTDGGFEAASRTDEEGFGWRFAQSTGVLKFSLDSETPREGGRSLRIEFAGNSEPASPVVSQLLLVEPGAKYLLSFSARTKELVSGGLPLVEVADARSKTTGAIAASTPFPTGGDWKDYNLEFTAPAEVNAVRISLRRAACSTSPCPAFGAAWLDRFELKRL